MYTPTGFVPLQTEWSFEPDLHFSHSKIIIIKKDRCVQVLAQQTSRNPQYIFFIIYRSPLHVFVLILISLAFRERFLAFFPSLLNLHQILLLFAMLLLLGYSLSRSSFFFLFYFMCCTKRSSSQKLGMPKKSFLLSA